MPITQIETLSLNGGLVKAIPGNQIGIAESPDCQNTDPSDILGVTLRAGSAQYASTGPTTASGSKGQGLFPWTRNAGTTFILTANATTIYSVDSGGSWLVLRNGMATDSIMQAAAVNNQSIIVASGLYPQYSTAGTAIASIASGTFILTLAKYVEPYVQKAFIFGDPVNPNKVAHSKSGDLTDFTTANNAGNFTIGESDGDILRGAAGTKRCMYFFKRNNTYVLTGDSPFNFEASKLRSIGLTSEYGIAKTGEGAFFTSDDGIYYAQGLDCALISEPIKPLYDAITDKSGLALEVKGKKLWCFYPSSGSGANDSAFVLDYARKMPTGGVQGIWTVYTGQPYSIAKLAQDNTLYAITNASSLQLYKLDTGTAATVTAYWTTPDMDYGDFFSQKSIARYYVVCKSPNATKTITFQWFNQAGSVGPAFTATVGTTGSYQMVSGPPVSTTSITGKTLKLKMSFSGPNNLTIYGFRIYADIRVEADMPRR